MTTTTLPTLYALTEAYGLALATLADAQTEEEIADCIVMLEAVNDDLKLKAERVAGLMREFEMRGEERAREAARIRKLADADSRRAEHIRAYLLREVKGLPEQRVETSRYVLAVRKNPPSVVVHEPALLTSEFQRTTITTDADKRAILQHLKATGEVLPGCEIVQTERLEVR